MVQSNITCTLGNTDMKLEKCFSMSEWWCQPKRNERSP